MVDTTDTVAVSAASDPDGDTLQYQWDLSVNNGSSYTTKRATQSGTSWSYNYINDAATTAAKWRVRAYDGIAYGPYSYSSNFTIRHNTTPTTPTPTSPVGGQSLDLNNPITLYATFNDPDSWDSVSKSDWRYRVVGAPAWTTETQSGNGRSRTLAAGTLSAGNYEWQIRYYDSSGAVSPYTASSFFTAAVPPAGPSIISPTSGSTVPQNTTLNWSTVSQSGYEVRRVASNGVTADELTVYELISVTTGQGAIDDRSAALNFNVNNRWEAVQLRVLDSGLWSTWVTTHVNVSYTPPEVPTITYTLFPDEAYVEVSFTNPVGAVNVVENEVWRKVSDEYIDDALEIFEKVATLPPTDLIYKDYEVASWQPVNYFIRSIGDNGVTNDSEVITATLVYEDAWIKDTVIPEWHRKIQIIEWEDDEEEFDQGIFSPLGKREYVVVQGIRRGRRGTIVIYSDDSYYTRHIKMMVNALHVLLIQIPHDEYAQPGEQFYVRLTLHKTKRIIKAFRPERAITLSYVEVDRDG